MRTEKGGGKRERDLDGAELSRNSSDADGNSSLFSVESASLFLPISRAYDCCLYLSRRISSSLARAVPEFTASPFQTLHTAQTPTDSSLACGCKTAILWRDALLLNNNKKIVQPLFVQGLMDEDLRPRESTGSFTWIIHRLVCRGFFSLPFYADSCRRVAKFSCFPFEKRGKVTRKKWEFGVNDWCCFGRPVVWRFILGCFVMRASGAIRCIVMHRNLDFG